MTNLYIRKDNKDIIARSDKEFPKPLVENTEPFITFRNVEVYKWLSAADKVDVYKGEGEKFIGFMRLKMLLWTHISDQDRALKEGIPIPEDCFEIREYEDDNWGQKTTKVYWAFFREVKQQEPQEPTTMKDLAQFPNPTYEPQAPTESQEELFSEVISIINRDVGEDFEYDAMGLLKAGYEIKRKDK